jgi:hypothetical protein
MRVLVLVDRGFSRRERALLSRLEIGLADEGVRVVHAVPISELSPDVGGVYSTVVGYQDTGLPLTRSLRASRLWGAIRRALEDDASGPSIDVVHCFGAGSWALALELGRLTGAKVLLEVWRTSQVSTAGALAQPREGRVTPAFCAADPALAAALRKRNARAEVRTAPWGVHTPSIGRFALPGQDIVRGGEGGSAGGMDDRAGPPAVAAAVLCDGHDSPALAAAMEGLARACRRFPQLMIFASAEDGRESALWRHGRRLDLLDRISLVPDMELRREPVLHMDLFVLPEASGQQRTLTLDAMAGGMVVLAAGDPMVEPLIDGRTAKLVRTASAPEWEQAVAWALTSPAQARTLTESAREYTRTQRTAAAHVSAVLGAYESLAKGGAMAASA